MLRKGSSLDTTLLHLDVLNFNSYLEIDTKDGYEYQKIHGYRLGKDGSLSAILADINDADRFRYVRIAKATGLNRSNRERGVG